MNAVQRSDLRAQSKAFWRRKQPHNKRPMRQSLKDLAERRARRRARVWLKRVTDGG